MSTLASIYTNICIYVSGARFDVSVGEWSCILSSVRLLAPHPMYDPMGIKITIVTNCGRFKAIIISKSIQDGCLQVCHRQNVLGCRGLEGRGIIIQDIPACHGILLGSYIR